nr:zinc finger protein 503-like [Pelodiscus sinensis]|eukprot:XP_014434610.1 zinc finger protein 503-like [Pelodiscus sinensis]
MITSPSLSAVRSRKLSGGSGDFGVGGGSSSSSSAPDLAWPNRHAGNTTSCSKPFFHPVPPSDPLRQAKRLPIKVLKMLTARTGHILHPEYLQPLPSTPVSPIEVRSRRRCLILPPPPTTVSLSARSLKGSLPGPSAQFKADPAGPTSLLFWAGGGAVTFFRESLCVALHPSFFGGLQLEGWIPSGAPGSPGTLALRSPHHALGLSSRYHPYSKSPLPTPGAPVPVPAATGPYYSPYALYGQRLTTASALGYQ